VRILLILALALAPASSQQPETLSLLEEPLYPPPLPRAERTRLEQEIAAARSDVARDAANGDAVLRLARAQRGLGHIGDALETLTRAIEGKGDAPALRLERGRGFIVIRKFELAQREFRKAAETVPEAHCDIGLALYLLADYKPSHQEYGKCPQPGVFGYLAARRAGESAGPRPAAPPDAAPRASEIKLPGSVANRPHQATSIGDNYMDAVDRLLSEHKPEAKALLKRIVEKNRNGWMDPVYVAAEADYARIIKAEPKKKKRKK
jgi:tetratricopeptide (TPR) repeat protein